MVITPSTLNVLIVGAMMIVFSFIWRIGAAFLADTSVGQAMAFIL